MAKRIFQGVVFFFALYAFVFLPLGKKSALEHIRAILGTPAAQEAASEVKGGVTRLVRRLESEARKSTDDTDRTLQQDGDEPDRDDPDRDGPRGGERKEAEAPRAVPKPRLRALSVEKPARDGL
jgi:hypothetical protein